MKTLAQITLILVFLSSGSLVLSGSRPLHAFERDMGAVQVDGHLFEKIPAESGNDSIRGRASEFVRNVGRLDQCMKSMPVRPPLSLPSAFRYAHSLRFEKCGKTKEIHTGTISGHEALRLFRSANGWECRDTASKKGIAIAVNEHGGRKYFVLIDRARNTFLSFSN